MLTLDPRIAKALASDPPGTVDATTLAALRAAGAGAWCPCMAAAT